MLPFDIFLVKIQVNVEIRFDLIGHYCHYFIIIFVALLIIRIISIQ
ncbi:Hypothetical protein I595_107 [Croceitalea dokdonensis DOKDO 023]|uniref:Uncharacterized protein n=1 Tax=Croceitalea dokdonensis DOKDO 023 TaxID=1300341 RepID=A0A0P7AYJ3_9FLAO|nr:Hypothetical protein I595_107 [Croceitalea dokdonensis DOKDO 023]